MIIPLLDAIAIQGKTLTVDALLTQRKFADYVVSREADYHFTVKNNQSTLREDSALFFENRQEPDFIDITPPDHGRIRTGHGPTNISRLRRFAAGLIKSKGADCVAQKMHELICNTRLVFDYLKMTKNSCAVTCS